MVATLIPGLDTSNMVVLKTQTQDKHN